MEQKINIAELLKECPSGMELDCINYNGVVTFEEILDCSRYPIKISVKYDNEYFTHTLTKYGQTCISPYNKCVIFPKGKTTWKRFVPPCKFEDGDIVATNDGMWIGIATGGIEREYTEVYCVIDSEDEFHAYLSEKETWFFSRLATEGEKQKLLQAIKDNGFKWNPESKTLEKLVKLRFKVGDRVKRYKDYISGIVTHISDDSYKVEYQSGGVSFVSFAYQNEWELIPNKFDINTLKPFESKVLVRTDDRKWVAAFYSHYDADASLHYCVAGGLWYEQCIPYENNEHLLNTADDCDNYFKNWEN